jgi:hypothetical protein
MDDGRELVTAMRYSDDERGRIMAEARSNIADRRELERDTAERRLDADMQRLRRKSLEPKPMLYKIHINEPTDSSIYQASAPTAGPSERELVEALGGAFAVERQKIREELRAEQAAELAALKNQIAELRGQLGVVLTLMSGSKAADVVTLPRRA